MACCWASVAAAWVTCALKTPTCRSAGGGHGDVVLQARRLFREYRLVPVESVCTGAITVLGQLRVALEILLRKDQRRLIRRNLMAPLLDDELLLIDLLIQRVDRRLRGGDIGASLVERGLIIARDRCAPPLRSPSPADCRLPALRTDSPTPWG